MSDIRDEFAALREQVEELVSVVEELSVKYHTAQRTVIHERSGNISTDLRALRQEVNDFRVYADLGPSPVPTAYPEEESEDQ